MAQTRAERLTQRVAELEAENERLRAELHGAQATGPSWLAAAFDRLDRFALYAQNWDSYEGLPPTDAAIATAKALLTLVANSADPARRQLSQPWAIAPFSEGVVLEWRSHGDAIEIEIDGSGQLGYLREQVRDGKSEYDEEDAITLDQARNNVRRLLTQNLPQ